MGKKLLILWSLLTILSSYALDIVKDGTAVSEIILSDTANPSQKLAAADLQEFFEKISGAKVEVVSAPTGKFKNKIYVGENDFSKNIGFDLKGTENGGYKVFVADDYAIIAGHDSFTKANALSRRDPEAINKFQETAGEKFGYGAALTNEDSKLKKLDIFLDDDTGTWYAAICLLEQLGVRFYAPGENGTVIPSAKNIILQKQNLLRKPHFPNRLFYFYRPNQLWETVRWMFRNGCGVSIKGDFGGHNTIYITTPDVTKKYPEIAGKDEKGKILPGRDNSGVPRLTNPKFRELAMKYVDAVFKYRPDFNMINLGMHDGFGYIDYEDSLKFKIGDKRGNRFSNYLWDYWGWAAREIKKKYPGKSLSVLAYASYFCPPDDVSLVPDNVVITLCYWTPWLQGYQRDEITAVRNQWLKILGNGGKLRHWDYFLYYSPKFPRIPVFFTKILQQDMQEMDGKSIGKFIEITYNQKKDGLTCPGLMHFMVYWQCKLFWEPNADREKVMNEYFKLYFGPAEKEMKEFYDFSEERYRNPIPLNKHTADSLKEYNGKYFEILSRARAKAGSGSVYDKRIAEIESEMSSLKKQHETLERTGPKIILQMFADMKKLDASPEKYMSSWRTLSDLKTGKQILQNNTEIKMALSADRSKLHLIAVCHEEDMKNIRAKCVKDDDPQIFNDDLLEIFISTPLHSYFHIAVNANGIVYDSTTDPELIERDTLPDLWNSGAKALVKKLEDRWIAEIEIPTKDFGNLGPSRDYTWGFQVGRTRFSGFDQQHQALAPTGGLYAEKTKWASLYLNQR